MSRLRSDSVIYALDLVILKHALDSVIHALDPVNHALYLFGLRGAGNVLPTRTLGRIKPFMA